MSSPPKQRLQREAIVTHSERETTAAGRELASGLSAGSVVLLFGDLGAGKTAFVRGLAEGLGISPDAVTSPTFTLMQEYAGERLPLFHVDLYRLNDPREIEWAEKLRDVPDGAIGVRIAHGEGDTRTIELTNSPIY